MGTMASPEQEGPCEGEDPAGDIPLRGFAGTAHSDLPEVGTPPSPVARGAAVSAGRGWRKYSLAVAASACSMVLCLHGNLTGEAWVMVQGIVLSLYGGSNIIDKRLGGAG